MSNPLSLLGGKNCFSTTDAMFCFGLVRLDLHKTAILDLALFWHELKEICLAAAIQNGATSGRHAVIMPHLNGRK